jgi:hypothetical protein
MKNTRLAVAGMTTALLGMTMGSASAETAPGGSIEHSTFDERRIERNPFLPIGWTKVTKSNDTAAFVSADSFKVTSIVVDSVGGLAIVNGEAYAPGEVVMTPVNGRQVPVRVKEVRDGEVVFFHNGKPIVAPLIAK